MTINELISLLETFRDAHGDLPVLVDDGCCNPAVIENVKSGVIDNVQVLFVELT